MLESLLDPDTARPSREKGPDAIKVNGYVVRGHWRKRWHPLVIQTQPKRRRRRQAVTPSMLEEDDGDTNFNR